jgi:hypothetical protein
VGETGEAAFGVVAMGAVEIGVVAMGDRSHGPHVGPGLGLCRFTGRYGGIHRCFAWLGGCILGHVFAAPTAR